MGVKSMPSGPEKDAAKKEVIAQAKKLDEKGAPAKKADASSAPSKEDSAADKQKADLVKKAYQVKSMPSGPEKDAAKKQVIAQANKLEEEKKKQEEEQKKQEEEQSKQEEEQKKQ